MLKEDVVKYVMETPYNTNEAVLRGLLEDIEGGEGGASIVKEPFEGAILEDVVLSNSSIALSNYFYLDDIAVTHIDIDETDLTKYNLTYDDETATIRVGEVEVEEEEALTPVILHLIFTTSEGETPMKMFFLVSKGQK